MNTTEYISNVLSSNNIFKSALEIKDLDKLHITKIRYDKLYFTYEDIKYFIIANYDCGDQWYSLYRKEYKDKYWSVNKINDSGWTFANIMDLLDNKSANKKNIIYSHIDKTYFVNKLRENNLIV